MERNSPKKQNQLTYPFNIASTLLHAVEITAKAGADEQYAANHDALVKGALNRRGLERYLETAESPQAVLVVDATNLKAINDIDSHDAGDRLIIDTYKMLKESTRPKDVIARVGGDEFVIILAHQGNGLDAAGDSGEKPPRTMKPIDNIEEAKERIAQVVQHYLDERPVLKRPPFNFDLAVGGVEWSSSMTINELLALAEDDMKTHKKLQHTAGQYRLIESHNADMV